MWRVATLRSESRKTMMAGRCHSAKTNTRKVSIVTLCAVYRNSVLAIKLLCTRSLTHARAANHNLYRNIYGYEV